MKIIDEKETHKRKEKRKKNRTRVMQAVAKGREINDFAEHLIKVFSD